MRSCSIPFFVFSLGLLVTACGEDRRASGDGRGRTDAGARSDARTSTDTPTRDGGTDAAVARDTSIADVMQSDRGWLDASDRDAGDGGPAAGLPDAGATCTSHASYRCDAGNLYWFDSCGIRQGMKEVCPSGCNGTACKCAPSCSNRVCGLDPICGTLQCGICQSPLLCTAAGTCFCDEGCCVQFNHINSITVVSSMSAYEWMVDTSLADEIAPPSTIGVVPSSATNRCIGNACIGEGGSLPDGLHYMALAYRRDAGAISPSVTVRFRIQSGVPSVETITDDSLSGETLQITSVRMTGSDGRPIVSWDLAYR